MDRKPELSRSKLENTAESAAAVFPESASRLMTASASASSAAMIDLRSVGTALQAHHSSVGQ